ncbi:MAG: GntP family permease [Chitinophagaceae bacterium]
MDILIILLALMFLIFVAYKGFSVILFAPIAAMLAVLFTSPAQVLPFFSAIFMEKVVGFIKLYFPVFLLGAIFGKLIAVSGFAKTITQFIVKIFGNNKAISAIVVVGAILTYGGVSLFVVAFALYPFASEMFKAADIPKRLIPATIALGAFTFTMDAFPGSPQIQNIIPTTFFHTDAWAAPWLGLCGGSFIFISGVTYLQWQKRKAARANEGYGENHLNEPVAVSHEKLPGALIAILPLILVVVFNKLFTELIPKYYGKSFDFSGIGIKDVAPVDIPKLTALWAVQGALIIGILTVLALAFNRVRRNFNAEINVSIGGALLATLNTASEFGFGGVIAALPGFKAVSRGIASTFQDPLINETITISALSAITGSASGGMSIALATMSETYITQASKLGISNEVLHRVASMASGGMDTLPHNGAVITLLLITGLTHKQAYKDIFVMTGFKTAGVFVIIGLYYLFGMV